MAIAIEVAHRDGDRPGSHAEILRALEGAIALAQQMETVLEVLATATSWWPSTLKSPTVVELGSAPTPTSGAALEGAIALAEQNGDAVASEIGCGQIRATIGIEVPHCNGR